MPPAGCVVQAGRYRARLLAPGEMGDRLNSLLVDLRTDSSEAPVGCIEVRVEQTGDYLIRSDGRTWNDAVPDPDVADQVVRMLLLAALDEEDALVHIHAGAVVLDGRTAVVAGWPGSGKSTAIAALVSSGLAYVTDERLVLSGDGRAVAGFPKPISLISGSFHLFPNLDPQRTGHGASNDTTWQVPASAFGEVAPAGFKTPSVLVFITYRPGAPLQVTDVPCVDAVARLLGDSPDVIARERDGANAIVALAASTPSVAIEYSAIDELVSMIRELLHESPPASCEEVTMLTGTADSDDSVPHSLADLDTARSYAVSIGASVWVIDDRAIAYLHRLGNVVEIDGVTTAWLQLLEPRSSVDELIDEVATATATDVAVVRSAARHAVHSLWSTGIIGPVTSSGPHDEAE